MSVHIQKFELSEKPHAIYKKGRIMEVAPSYHLQVFPVSDSEAFAIEIENQVV